MSSDICGFLLEDAHNSLSVNPLIGPAVNTHLTYTQRVMREVVIQA
jgi:hypothetical protein